MAEPVVEEVMGHLDGNPEPTVAALGLTVEPDFDDLRESPAAAIVAELADRLPPNGRILAVEPNINELTGVLAVRLNVILSTLAAALDEADVVVLLVDHREFKEYGSADELTVPIVDTRGIWRR